jgi:hypothetical protein
MGPGWEDRHEAVTLIECLALSTAETEAWLALLQVQTKQIVESAWSQITAVAAELCVRRKMTGADV